MKKIFMLIMFVVISQNAWCSKYPVITSLDPVLEGVYGPVSYKYKYYITQAIVDVGTSADYVPPAGYSVGLGHRHDPDDTPGSGTASPEYNDGGPDGKKTMSEVMLAFYEKTGKKQAYVEHYGNIAGPNECVGYFAYKVYNYSIPWSSVILPGGCLSVPPADQWCKITTPEILLDHGSITLKDAENSSVSKQLDLECVGDMAVSFKLVTNDNYIYLDDGKSEIKINDQPLGDKVSLPGGKSAVTIKDMLTGVKTEGVHSGSSVLVMMPY